MRLIFAVILLCITALPVYAAPKHATSSEQTNLGTFNSWRTYSFKEGNNTVCYMTATGSGVANFKRSTPRLTITHRPADNVKDTISYNSGYPFKSGTSANMTIGKTKFDLFTDKETGWARDNSTDHAIAAAIRNAGTLTVNGTPTNAKAKPVTDRFTLAGADTAYRAIGKACGYPDEPKPVAAKKPAKAAATSAKVKKTAKH